MKNNKYNLILYIELFKIGKNMIKIIKYTIFIISFILVLLIGAKFSGPIKSITGISNKSDIVIDISEEDVEDMQNKIQEQAPSVEFEKKIKEEILEEESITPPVDILDIPSDETFETLDIEEAIETDTQMNMDNSQVSDKIEMEVETMIEEEKAPEIAIEPEEIQEISADDIVVIEESNSTEINQ